MDEHLINEINILLYLSGCDAIRIDESNEFHYANNNDLEFSDKNKELLGTEYFDIGQEAITKLMNEKNRFIRNAFHRNDIGDIALIWGDDKKGLCHIIKRRKETKQPLRKLLQSMEEVINNGTLNRGNNNEFLIKYKGKVIVTMAHLSNDMLQFIVTAFYEK